MKDLCDEENFPNLEDDFHLVYKKNRLISFTDQENNTWIRKKIINEALDCDVFINNSYNLYHQTDLLLIF